MGSQISDEIYSSVFIRYDYVSPPEVLRRHFSPAFLLGATCLFRLFGLELDHT